MSSDMQLSDDYTRAEAEHRRWQAIHRYYVRAMPYRDDPEAARPRQWQLAMAIAWELLDLWTCWTGWWRRWTAQHAEDARLRRAGGALVEREPTYIVFLEGLANKSARRARRCSGRKLQETKAGSRAPARRSEKS
jgi:hypothetical protein